MAHYTIVKDSHCLSSFHLAHVHAQQVVYGIKRKQHTKPIIDSKENISPLKYTDYTL